MQIMHPKHHQSGGKWGVSEALDARILRKEGGEKLETLTSRSWCGWGGGWGLRFLVLDKTSGLTHLLLWALSAWVPAHR